MQLTNPCVYSFDLRGRESRKFIPAMQMIQLGPRRQHWGDGQIQPASTDAQMDPQVSVTLAYLDIFWIPLIILCYLILCGGG